ncbi:DNA-binding transcription repressor ASH1 KNAG_0D04520 [Huiozyma naganishii CBS 8797]|uniref:GATA-type domain-containing protein n=1 Tax=Huiozyma naganishii (strain ATCC MYA-139 / BCRC 22969 / CBS 8797 / KCTC 17520 / NBRC 10181 / NCYC 3082 / Yp74L-3) TaxID=1071383 RepID=J7RYF9_HUIN7|nr:hypothetical protein KNAG_0D04520 [Kazachstania naganishii CBS 8797]CCK70197.1 hypothetical protein KNAG_0D04520 [Kazachstania naganishii CBS 8797]
MLTHSPSTRHSYFADNLLLPPLQTGYEGPRGWKLHANSATVSPSLVPMGKFGLGKRKSFTAPPSPTHLLYHPHPIMTPNSPLSSLAPTTATTLNKIDKKRGRERNSVAHVTKLPSLRHLNLLPDPRIQENSYIYPDTSETTPLWRANLVHWCKGENYQDFMKIKDNAEQATHVKVPPSVPSILKPKDQFQQLATSRIGAYNGSTGLRTPVTPPMSPKRQCEDSEVVEPLEGDLREKKFTPFVSEKLVQLVREQIIRGKGKGQSHGDDQMDNISGTSAAQGRSTSHRKTNSFKALQIRHMLNDRDILSPNSKRISKPMSRKSRASTQTTDSTGQMVLKLNSNSFAGITIASLSSSSASSHEFSPASHNAPLQYRSRSPTRSRARSVTPPANRARASSTTATPASASASLSQPSYHRFTLGTPSTSPVRSSLIKTTPKVTTQSMNGNAAMPLKSHSVGSTPRTKKHYTQTGQHHYPATTRVCVSCHSSDSPCWRPSWSIDKHDQLCNSCGLRFKKTHTRCLNNRCRKIPTKGELNIMKARGVTSGVAPDTATTIVGYRCLFCDSMTATEH